MHNKNGRKGDLSRVFTKFASQESFLDYSSSNRGLCSYSDTLDGVKSNKNIGY